MGALIAVNVGLAGFFACAAIHYAFHWWLSRHERVLLVFSVQCALFAVLGLAMNSFFQATTIPASQAALDRIMTLGGGLFVVILQFYANLGDRRDRAFRALVTGALVFLAVLNQWAPLRGTVLELRTMPLPWGGTGMLPIRTPPGASLAIQYLSVLAILGYGFFVARAIWKRDRAGAILIAVGAAAMLGGVALGILVDFAKVRAPYPGPLGHVVNVLCVTFFLSREYSARGALRGAKEEAERASQAKSRFLAHMSHEIRSPLHVMLLNAEILEGDRSLGIEQLKSVETIQKSGQHLAMLINNVLEMSTIEAGRLALVERPFDVGATLDEVAQMFGAQAAANGTELRVEPTFRLAASLLGDGGKVKQILINLVGNAIKFTRHGSIRVTATSKAVAEAAALVEIVVADTGTGIAEPDLARIFQPFEQLDGGARVGGTGLGLAISAAYARLMGGDISVVSTPGAGSRFKLTFLAKRVEPDRMRESFEPPVAFAAIALTRSKVLVVDDVDVIRDGVATLLAKNAFEARTAPDGPTALSIHSDWRPDVVLMDLRMPGMNGIDVIQRLRAVGSTAAIGALTAGAFGDDEREARRAGADFFIRKPFDERALLDRLALVLAARGPREPGRDGAVQGTGASNRRDVRLG